MDFELQPYFRKINFDEKFYSESVDKLVTTYNGDGSIPHCIFKDLAEIELLVSHKSSFENEIELFCCIEGFTNSNGKVKGVYCTRLSKVARAMLANKTRSLILRNKYSSLKIEGNELIKLLETILTNKNMQDEVAEFDEIEFEEGSEIIFSTPDPDLPQEFIDYLKSVLNPLKDVEAIYIFETQLEGEDQSSLVLGIKPASGKDDDDFDKIIMLLSDGVDRYISEWDQVDFMIITDEEILELAESVSPVVDLDR